MFGPNIQQDLEHQTSQMHIFKHKTNKGTSASGAPAGFLPRVRTVFFFFFFFFGGVGVGLDVMVK